MRKRPVIGVTHMPDNLAKSELLKDLVSSYSKSGERGVIRNHVSPRPASGLAFTGATSPQDGVHSRTFLEVSVLAGALCAADQRGDKLRACTSPSCTAAAQRPFGEVALSACVKHETRLKRGFCQLWKVSALPCDLF